MTRRFNRFNLRTTKESAKWRVTGITGKEWLESLAERTLSGQELRLYQEQPCHRFGEGAVSSRVANDLAELARKVIVHQGATAPQQLEMPRVHRRLLSLHMRREPKKGVSLGFLDSFRLFFLKRRAVRLRKRCFMEEINQHSDGMPQFGELYTATNQHVSFNRRKLFDVVLPIEHRRRAAESIIHDFDILCPHKPNSNFKPMNRLRDQTRRCLVGRSTLGIPFEASDFMTRWMYRRALQTSELNGLQLTRIPEQALEEDRDLSVIGSYKLTKCLASQIVAAHRAARIVDVFQAASSFHTSDRRFSTPLVPSIVTIKEAHNHSLHWAATLRSSQNSVAEEHSEGVLEKSVPLIIMNGSVVAPRKDTTDFTGDAPGISWVHE